MKIKHILIITFSSVFAFVAILTGYRMMVDMQQKKACYEVDLFSLIPPEPKALIYVHNVRTFFANQLIKEATSLIWDETLNSLLINDALLSLHSEGEILYIKTGREDIGQLLAPVKSCFETQKINEKGVDIHIITLTDNRFFCYVYHQGVWIGSLQKRLIVSAIKQLSAKKSLKQDTLFASALKGLGQKVTANIIINTDSIGYFQNPLTPDTPIHPIKKWIGCDLSDAGENVWFSGFIDDENFIDKKDEKPTLNLELIPTNSYLVYQPYGDSCFYISFHATDTVKNGGTVKLISTELPGFKFDKNKENIFCNYVVLADSSETVEAFIASLKQDSLNNVRYSGFSAGLNEGVGCRFDIDLEQVLSEPEQNTLFLPTWIREQKELLSSYNLYYYTTIDESKCLFNLILCPKEGYSLNEKNLATPLLRGRRGGT